MASSSASNSALRQRKGGATSGSAPTDANDSSNSKKKNALTRSQSWHEAAAGHVLSRRRYFLLTGVLLGIASMFVARVLYLDQPIEDIIPIPSETVRRSLFD